MGHTPIRIETLSLNPFTKIGREWMLISAGNITSFNTMTASWGGLGFLWEKNIAFCVIRPQRHTRKFIEENQFFTLCFFDSEHKNALEICGKYSGRDVDKVKMAKLTPVEDEEYKTIYFEEAKLVLVCKKIYYQDLNPENFLDPNIDKFYPSKDYHRMFVGEVVKVLTK